MNYIKQLNGFWNWAMLKSVSQSEISLYLAILHCANISNWEPNLSLPNSALLSYSKISSVTQLSRVRNRLIQDGLISYQKGKKGTAGIYIINKLYTENVTECVSDTVSNTDNNLYNNMCTYINNKHKQNETIPPISPRGGSVPYKEIAELYNTICTRLPKVTTLNDSRKRAIKARFGKHSLDDFRDVFKKANKSDFLTGGNKTGWIASFDWLMKDANFVKVAEDTYANRNGNSFGFANDSHSDYDEIEKIIRGQM